MNNIQSVDVIDPNSIAHFFELSTWQSWLAFGFVAFSIISFLLYRRATKKTKSYPIAFGFLLAGIGAIIFGTINQVFPPEQLNTANAFLNYGEFIGVRSGDHSSGSEIITWHTEASSWLGMITSIYLGLIIIAIPIYVFVNLVSALVRKRGNNLTGRTVGINVVALGIMPIIGIAVAFALIPLIQFLVPSDAFADTVDSTLTTTLPGIIESVAPATLAIFGSVAGIASVSILGLIFGFVIRNMKKQRSQHANSAIKFFTVSSDVLNKYMRTIAKMVPLVIATRLPLFAMTDFSVTGQVVGGFIAVYFVGWIAIFAIQTIIISFIGGKKTMWANIKRWFSIQTPTMLEVFTHNNTVAATPKIAKNARKLGSCNGVAQFNSGLSTSLGTTMCGGFYPALILLTTLVATGGNLNPETLVVMFFMTSMVALLIPHAPGSDVTLNVALLGMFGLPTSVFEVMFTFMPINEPFNQVINLNGKVLAALITEKFHRRHGYDAHCNGDKCDCISHAPSKKEELTAPVDNMSNLKGVQDE